MWIIDHPSGRGVKADFNKAFSNTVQIQKKLGWQELKTKAK
jgi:hypothetical protein